MDEIKNLLDLTVADLSLGDSGRRIVITRDGVTIDGSLDRIMVFGTEKKGEYFPMITIRIISTDTAVEMTKLPLDYRLQIERVSLDRQSKGCTCTFVAIDRGVGPGEEVIDPWGCAIHDSATPAPVETQEKGDQ